METIPSGSASARSGHRAGRVSDWVGFFVFGGLSVWAVLRGWLPVARQSLLAGALILPAWLTSCLVAVGFLRRRPLIGADRNWGAKAAAYFVTFIVPVYFGLFRGHLPLAAAGARFVIPITLSLGADVFALWSTWTLRHAMSVEPQARVLLTGGPYRYARHPLYAAYLVHNLATALLFSSFELWGLMAAWFVALLYRIRCEERVLGAYFPEYPAFRRRVWMFSPRWF